MDFIGGGKFTFSLPELILHPIHSLPLKWMCLTSLGFNEHLANFLVSRIFLKCSFQSLAEGLLSEVKALSKSTLVSSSSRSWTLCGRGETSLLGSKECG